MAIFTSEQILPLLAQAYFDAASRCTDMRIATEALENLRLVLTTEERYIRIWHHMSDMVGRTSAKGLQPILVELRHKIEETLIQHELARLEPLLERDSDEGWREWLDSYMQAFDEAGWWLSFCYRLVDAPLNFPTQMEPPIERVRYYTKCMLHNRWGETLDWLLYLGRQERFQLTQRANMLVAAGEVELYHLLRNDHACGLFQQAEGLAPEYIRVHNGWAEYWLEQPTGVEKATQYAEKMVNEAPSLCDGFLNMGDCYLKNDDAIGAEAQYQQGIRNAPGNASGYHKLLRLYGRREGFQYRRDLVADLARTAAMVDPDSAYDTYLYEGAVYQQNGLYKEAHKCHLNAMALDATRVGAYCADGYTYLDECSSVSVEDSGDVIGKARGCFETAIQVAPEALDGYWGLSWLCEEQGIWEEALQWCEESLQRRPQWESVIRTRMGGLKRRQEQYEAAEKLFEEVLWVEPTHQPALEGLSDLAKHYYLKANDSVGALRVLEKRRKVEGEPYEAEYQSEIGAVHCYFGHYQEAAESYRRAIQASPDTVTYYVNLAEALEQLKTPGNRKAELKEAIDALHRSLRLTTKEDEKGWNIKTLNRLERELRFVSRYGERALQHTPLVKPIRVFLQHGWLPLVLSEGTSELSPDTLHKVDEMRQRVRESFGFTLPGINFTKLEGAGIQEGEYRFQLKEERNFLDGGRVPLEKKFVHGSKEVLTALRLDGEAPVTEAREYEGVWVSETDADRARQSGLPVSIPLEYLIRHLQDTLENNLWEFVDHQTIVELLAETASDEGREIAMSTKKVTGLTVVIRHLMRLGLPILSLQEILRPFLDLDRRGINLRTINEEMEALVAGSELARTR